MQCAEEGSLTRTAMEGPPMIHVNCSRFINTERRHYSSDMSPAARTYCFNEIMSSPFGRTLTLPTLSLL